SLAESGSLVVKHLGLSHAVLAASPALLARQGAPTQPADLARMDSVVMSSTDGKAQWKLFGPNGAQQTVTHTPVFIADDLLTLKFAVLGGVGMAILPDYMCLEEIESGRLVSVLPEWAPQPGIVHAVFASRRGL